MMDKFRNRLAASFSPFLTGLSIGFLILLALSVLTFVGPRPGRLIWAGLLVYLVAGGVLELSSERVLHFRLYGALGAGLATLAYATLAWNVAVRASDESGEVLAPVVIASTLLSFGALVLIYDQRNPQRARMPQGNIGKLDTSTGKIVDLRYRQMSHGDRKEQSTGGLIVRLSPVIGGLTMLLARSLSNNVAFLIFIPSGMIMAAITTLMAAFFLSSAIATARWERKHGKRIYVAQR